MCVSYPCPSPSTSLLLRLMYVARDAPLRPLRPAFTQTARAFNQPLSLDTSSVTDMNHMFRVSSAFALSSKPSLRRALLTCSTYLPSVPLDLQSADAFNQPLSIDTSSVTNMEGMFRVSSLMLPPCSCLSVHSACTAHVIETLCTTQPPFGFCTQTAQEFNQALSLDTSSATGMESMFKVRAPL